MSNSVMDSCVDSTFSGAWSVGHIYSIPIGIIDLQGQRVGSLLSGRNGALGNRRKKAISEDAAGR